MFDKIDLVYILSKYGNYVPSTVNASYNAFIYIDRTMALHPLHIKPNGHQVPDTYPYLAIKIEAINKHKLIGKKHFTKKSHPHGWLLSISEC